MADYFHNEKDSSPHIFPSREDARSLTLDGAAHLQLPQEQANHNCFALIRVVSQDKKSRCRPGYAEFARAASAVGRMHLLGGFCL